jgi:N-acetylmuramoyl-L-alanine amidase
VFELSAVLARTYPIAVLVGHEEIAPGRKSDPGPAFPLDRLRDRILGAGRMEDAPAAAPLATASLSPAVLSGFGVSGSGKPDSGGDGKPDTGGSGKPVTGGIGKPGTK